MTAIGSKLSILIAEDDESAIALLRSVLCANYPGATIHTAYDGINGLASFRKNLPDIVITDINMPELDGVGMAREIRTIKPDARLIALTAYTDSDDPGSFTFDEYLTKPVDIRQLFKAIDRCAT